MTSAIAGLGCPAMSSWFDGRMGKQDVRVYVVTWGDPEYGGESRAVQAQLKLLKGHSLPLSSSQPFIWQVATQHSFHMFPQEGLHTGNPHTSVRWMLLLGRRPFQNKPSFAAGEWVRGCPWL